MMMVRDNIFFMKSFLFHSYFSLEKQQLIDETVDNFNSYINPGFLKYRKSFSPDYVAGMFNYFNEKDFQ